MLLIEHDIDRVLALSDRYLVLHQGRLILADGIPADVVTNPEVVTAYLGAARETEKAETTVPAEAMPRHVLSAPLLRLRWCAQVIPAAWC